MIGLSLREQFVMQMCIAFANNGTNTYDYEKVFEKIDLEYALRPNKIIAVAVCGDEAHVFESWLKGNDMCAMLIEAGDKAIPMVFIDNTASVHHIPFNAAMDIKKEVDEVYTFLAHYVDELKGNSVNETVSKLLLDEPYGCCTGNFKQIEYTLERIKDGSYE